MTVDDPCEAVGFGDGDGGEPPAPDCGTRIHHLKLLLDFDRRDYLGLSDDPDAEQPALFKNCPAYGAVYPTIWRAGERGILRDKLPLKALRNPKKKTLVAEASNEGTYAYPGAGIVVHTAISWKVMLERLKR